MTIRSLSSSFLNSVAFMRRLLTVAIQLARQDGMSALVFRLKEKLTLLRQIPLGRINIPAQTGQASKHYTKRVLIIDAFSCTPDKDSGSMRMWEILNLLNELDCKVTYITLDLNCRTPSVERLRRNGIEVICPPETLSVTAYLQDSYSLFDLIVLSRAAVAKRFMDWLIARNPRPCIVFDTVDLQYLREERLARLSKLSLDERQAQGSQLLETRLVKQADVTLVVSTYEQEKLRRELPGCDIRVLSNIHKVHRCNIPFSKRRDAMFIGGFKHKPNIDAVLFLAEQIIPLVISELPDFRVYVIGSDMPASIRHLGSAHLVMKGFVNDPEPYFSLCKFSLAPLRFGAGVKGKINQSMSYGLPVISTSIGVEGMHLVSGRDVLVADEAATFAESIVRLYRDEELWKTLSRNGISNVERYFSQDAALSTLRHLLGTACKATVSA